MKEQNYSQATLKYTLAINKAKTPNHIYYGNRALANLKQNKNKFCIKDCDEAIKIDPAFVKCYSRKATALSNIKQYNEALETVKIGIKHDPENVSLKSLETQLTDIVSR